MNKRLTKEQIFEKVIKGFEGYNYLSHGSVKEVVLKAMSEYAAQQIKPWRAKVRKLHDENYRIKTDW